MRISTSAQAKCVSSILSNHSLSIAEKHVLDYIQNNFLRNAEKNAFSWAPDGRTHFLHQEVIQYLPLEVVSDKVTKLLSEVGITFEKTTIKGIFPVVKS